MDSNLKRADRLSDGAWTAIDHYRGRLQLAATSHDRPGAVGTAKELIESVAKVVCDGTESSVEDKANVQTVIGAAQAALQRAAGKDVGGHRAIRDIASSAQKMPVSVVEVRNDVGVGHGRSRVADIDDDMVEMVIDAAMLWCRWAPRRLGHVLARFPEFLMEAVAGGTTRVELQSCLDDVVLPEQQPPMCSRPSASHADGRQRAGTAMPGSWASRRWPRVPPWTSSPRTTGSGWPAGCC